MSDLGSQGADDSGAGFLIQFLILALSAFAFKLVSGLQRQFFEQRISKLYAEHCAVQPCFIVDLTINQGATPTGRDKGALWFSGDRLCFSGHRTSFALSTANIIGPSVDQPGVEELSSAFSIDLAKTTSVGPLSLDLEFLAVRPTACEKMRRDFVFEFLNWTISKSSVAGQWPPLTLGPGIPRTVTLFWSFIVPPLVLWILFVALITHSLDAGVILVTIIVGAAICLLLPEIWRVAASWRAFRDRRKLDAQPKSLSPWR